jgi:hypothetical protein
MQGTSSEIVEHSTTTHSQQRQVNILSFQTCKFTTQYNITEFKQLIWLNKLGKIPRSSNHIPSETPTRQDMMHCQNKISMKI